MVQVVQQEMVQQAVPVVLAVLVVFLVPQNLEQVEVVVLAVMEETVVLVVAAQVVHHTVFIAHLLP